MRVRGREVLVGLAACVALGGAISLQILRDRWYPREEQEHRRILYVRSGEALKRIVLGFDALAADVYWIRALQHYGGDRLTGPVAGAKYQLLYPLLDLTTTLDPYFNIAYRFGAIFLSEGYPGGPGRPDQSVALLRKALVAMPQKWQYYHDIGFVYYWRMHDFQSAATWFRRAAEQPGAPNWLDAAGRVDAVARAGPRRGPVHVAADPEVRGGVAAAQRRARAGAVVRAGPDRSADRHRPAPPAGGRRALLVVRAHREAGAHARAGGPDRDPLRPGPGHRPGDGLAAVFAVPDARDRHRGGSSEPRSPAAGHPGRSGPCRRQLSQRLRPPHPPPSIAVPPRLALPELRIRPALVRQHPRGELRRSRRPVPEVPGARSPSATRPSRSRRWPCSCCTGSCSDGPPSWFRGWCLPARWWCCSPSIWSTTCSPT